MTLQKSGSLIPFATTKFKFVAVAAALSLSGLSGTAHAQIGLSHAKKGGSYLSIEGGYQNRSGVDTAVPQAGGSNPYADGTHVRQRAFASPDRIDVTTSISQGNNSATTSTTINADGSSVDSSTQQSSGDRFISTNTTATAYADPSRTDSTSFVSMTGQDVGAGGTSPHSTYLQVTGYSRAWAEQVGNLTGAGAINLNGQASAIIPGHASGDSVGELRGTNVFAAGAAASVAVSENTGVGSGIATVPNSSAQFGWAPASLTAGAQVQVPDRSAGSNVLFDNPVGPAELTVVTTASQIDSTTAVAGGLAGQNSLLRSGTAGASVGSTAAEAQASYNFQGEAATIRVTGSTESAVAKLDAQDGAFGGVSYGYVLPRRMWGFLDRLEAYGTFSNNDDTSQSTGYSFTATSSDGQVAIGEFDTDGIANNASVSDRTREIGMRFKSDNFTDTSFPLIVSLEPFYRNEKIRTRAAIGDSYAQESNASTDMYGVQLALETEIDMFIPELSFIGRIAGGGYAVSFDQHSAQHIATYSEGSSSGDDATGYRLGAEAGFRFAASDTSFVSATGAVDHFSKAATTGARQGMPSASLGKQTDYQAKLNFIFLN